MNAQGSKKTARKPARRGARKETKPVVRVGRAKRADGNRGSGRGRSPSPVVRRLRTEAGIAIGFDPKAAEKLAIPDIAFHIGLVPHGFEAHLFIDGSYRGAMARDFSSDYTIDHLKLSLSNALTKALDTWRSKL